ncbi:MAG: inverse autotransporter beta domain-containing protein [Gammaproteobacteria bacterium]
MEYYLEDEADISGRWRESAARAGWDLAVLAVDETVMAATAGAARRGFIRNIEVDLQSELGGRFAQAGLNVLGAFRETADDAVAWQLRGYGGGGGISGGNAGLIYRRAGEASFGDLRFSRLFGANVFIDYETRDGEGFYRLSGGGEVRSPWVDFFANYYAPLGDAVIRDASDGGRTATYTAGGYDAELNVHSPEYPWLVGVAEYYVWEGEYGREDDSGIRAGLRIESRGSPITWEVLYQSGEEGNAVGGRLSFRHEIGKAYSGIASASEFNARDWFFAPVAREYSQRIYTQNITQAGSIYRLLGIVSVAANGDENLGGTVVLLDDLTAAGAAANSPLTSLQITTETTGGTFTFSAAVSSSVFLGGVLNGATVAAARTEVLPYRLPLISATLQTDDSRVILDYESGDGRSFGTVRLGSTAYINGLTISLIHGNLSVAANGVLTVETDNTTVQVMAGEAAEFQVMEPNTAASASVVLISSSSPGAIMVGATPIDCNSDLSGMDGVAKNCELESLSLVLNPAYGSGTLTAAIVSANTNTVVITVGYLETGTPDTTAFLASVQIRGGNGNEIFSVVDSAGAPAPPPPQLAFDTTGELRLAGTFDSNTVTVAATLTVRATGEQTVDLEIIVTVGGYPPPVTAAVASTLATGDGSSGSPYVVSRSDGELATFTPSGGDGAGYQFSLESGGNVFALAATPAAAGDTGTEGATLSFANASLPASGTYTAEVRVREPDASNDSFSVITLRFMVDAPPALAAALAVNSDYNDIEDHSVVLSGNRVRVEYLETAELNTVSAFLIVTVDGGSGEGTLALDGVLHSGLSVDVSGNKSSIDVHFAANQYLGAINEAATLSLLVRDEAIGGTASVAVTVSIIGEALAPLTAGFGTEFSGVGTVSTSPLQVTGIFGEAVTVATLEVGGGDQPYNVSAVPGGLNVGVAADVNGETIAVLPARTLSDSTGVTASILFEIEDAFAGNDPDIDLVLYAEIVAIDFPDVVLTFNSGLAGGDGLTEAAALETGSALAEIATFTATGGAGSGTYEYTTGGTEIEIDGTSGVLTFAGDILPTPPGVRVVDVTVESSANGEVVATDTARIYVNVLEEPDLEFGIEGASRFLSGVGSSASPYVLEITLTDGAFATLSVGGAAPHTFTQSGAADTPLEIGSSNGVIMFDAEQFSNGRHTLSVRLADADGVFLDVALHITLTNSLLNGALPISILAAPDVSGRWSANPGTTADNDFGVFGNYEQAIEFFDGTGTEGGPALSLSVPLLEMYEPTYQLRKVDEGSSPELMLDGTNHVVFDEGLFPPYTHHSRTSGISGVNICRRIIVEAVRPGQTDAVATLTVHIVSTTNEGTTAERATNCLPGVGISLATTLSVNSGVSGGAGTAADPYIIVGASAAVAASVSGGVGTEGSYLNGLLGSEANTDFVRVRVTGSPRFSRADVRFIGDLSTPADYVVTLQIEDHQTFNERVQLTFHFRVPNISGQEYGIGGTSPFLSGDGSNGDPYVLEVELTDGAFATLSVSGSGTRTFTQIQSSIDNPPLQISNPGGVISFTEEQLAVGLHTLTVRVTESGSSAFLNVSLHISLTNSLLDNLQISIDAAADVSGRWSDDPGANAENDFGIFGTFGQAIEFFDGTDTNGPALSLSVPVLDKYEPDTTYQLRKVNAGSSPELLVNNDNLIVFDESIFPLYTHHDLNDISSGSNVCRRIILEAVRPPETDAAATITVNIVSTANETNMTDRADVCQPGDPSTAISLSGDFGGLASIFLNPGISGGDGTQGNRYIISSAPAYVGVIVDGGVGSASYQNGLVGSEENTNFERIRSSEGSLGKARRAHVMFTGSQATRPANGNYQVTLDIEDQQTFNERVRITFYFFLSPSATGFAAAFPDSIPQTPPWNAGQFPHLAALSLSENGFWENGVFGNTEFPPPRSRRFGNENAEFRNAPFLRRQE